MEALQKLLTAQSLNKDEWISLIADRSHESEIREMACEKRDEVYGRVVYARGLIEFTSICRNDCYYCGLRKSNAAAERYRLSSDEILSTVSYGHSIGFRTFVLQGGEDPYFTAERLSEIVREIKYSYPDSAVTLSVGEMSDDDYAVLRAAGTDRYLLRHETADRYHYSILHPSSMSFDNRIRALKTLKRLGFQTGAGMMIGTPGSSYETLAEDMLFISSLKPAMVGVGPFIPHKDTPFGGKTQGSTELTLHMLSLLRLLDPHLLLPSTTALGTAEDNGHVKGFMHGANVIMPNLTPMDERRKYLLYDGKKITGEEAGENIEELRRELRKSGYQLSLERGDYR